MVVLHVLLLTSWGHNAGPDAQRNNGSILIALDLEVLASAMPGFTVDVGAGLVRYVNVFNRISNAWDSVLRCHKRSRRRDSTWLPLSSSRF